MATREELIETLRANFHNLILYPSTIDRVADFIIADRKRIVAPLVGVISRKSYHPIELDIAAKQAILLAGEETGAAAGDAAGDAARAAWAAARAAWAAGDAARNQMQTKILNHGIKLLRG